MSSSFITNILSVCIFTGLLCFEDKGFEYITFLLLKMFFIYCYFCCYCYYYCCLLLLLRLSLLSSYLFNLFSSSYCFQYYNFFLHCCYCYYCCYYYLYYFYLNSHYLYSYSCIFITSFGSLVLSEAYCFCYHYYWY